MSKKSAAARPRVIRQLDEFRRIVERDSGPRMEIRDDAGALIADLSTDGRLCSDNVNPFWLPTGWRSETKPVTLESDAVAAWLQYAMDLSDLTDLPITQIRRLVRDAHKLLNHFTPRDRREIPNDAENCKAELETVGRLLRQASGKRRGGRPRSRDAFVQFAAEQRQKTPAITDPQICNAWLQSHPDDAEATPDNLKAAKKYRNKLHKTKS